MHNGLFHKAFILISKKSLSSKRYICRSFTLDFPGGKTAAIVVCVATYLDNILTFHRERALKEKESLPLDELVKKADDYNTTNGLPRSLSAHLQNNTETPEDIPRLIAEIKKHSPSKGNLQIGLDPVATAREYESGGASAISVLTDEPHFKGHLSYLEQVKNAVALPVLRKDFLVSKEDVLISRIRGADAILLIVAALSDEELATMHETALSLSMDVLVEIHDENELARAMAIKPAIIGINQRDLHSFAIDTKRAIRLRSSIGTDIITVAESGINSFADMLLLGSEGFDAALVGENLVIQNDRCLAVQKLLGKQTAI